MQAYECHFGFRESPFNLTPDPRFFYATPAYREAYATLRYGVEARKGFVLISGEAGTGKTTLLRMLMQQADSSIHTAFICNPPGSFTELLRVIMNELELPEPSNDRVTVTAQFNDYLLDQLKQDHIVSLLVDEAQNLSQEMLEELRLLSNFETHKAKLIQMVLVGQPELEQRLEKPELRQLKQRVALRCCLKPLRPEDVARYIEFRLAVAGYEGGDLFDRGTIQKIALYTHGIPRLINVLCDNALLRACHREAGKVSVEMIDEAARDLCFTEARPAAASTADSEACTTDLGLAGAASVKRSVSMSLGAETSAKPIPAFRKRMSARLLVIGLWWIATGVLAVASAMFYLPRNEQLLMSVRDGAEQLVGSRPNKADQKEILAPAPGVDSPAGKRAGTETFSLDPYASFTGDVKQDTVTPEMDQGSVDGQSGAATPNRGRMEGKPIDDIRSHPGENGSTVRSNPEKAVRVAKRMNGRSSLGVFNVVGSSFVREKPSADAEITGTLEPGTRIQVVSKTGDYLRVQALNKQTISGYVHREDAFFEPSH